MGIEKLLADRAAAVNRELLKQVKAFPACHARLRDAMAYSLEAGGKRLRPALLTAAYEIGGGNWRKVLPAACALEMVHTYSLIHDDLPAMDDDDLRRGRPTNHKVYGEAMAILAGDGLLTSAFSVLFSNAGGIKRDNTLKAAEILAFRAGASGMVAGQAADLEAEGFLKQRSPDKKKAARLLAYIHQHKTSDMIMASVEMGAALAGMPERDYNTLSAFARDIGLCFQITDDILDVVGDKKKLGKSGSDARNRKLTYVSLYGIEDSRARAAKLIKAAHAKLAALRYPRSKVQVLGDIADFVYGREK